MTLHTIRSLLEWYQWRTLFIITEYMCHKWKRIPCMFRLSLSQSGSFLIHDLSTGFVTRVTRRAPIVEQELPTLLRHLTSLPRFSHVRVLRSLFLCVVFCGSLLMLKLFFFYSPLQIGIKCDDVPTSLSLLESV